MPLRSARPIVLSRALSTLRPSSLQALQTLRPRPKQLSIRPLPTSICAALQTHGLATPARVRVARLPVLLAGQPGVTASCPAPRFLRERAVARQTFEVQFAGVNRLFHGASGFARVGAVGESAFAGEFSDVFEGSVDGVGVARRPERSHSRGIGDRTAPCDGQLAHRGGVPPFHVALAHACRGEVGARKRVGQGGLSCAGPSDEDGVSPGIHASRTAAIEAGLSLETQKASSTFAPSSAASASARSASTRSALVRISQAFAPHENASAQKRSIRPTAGSGCTGSTIATTSTFAAMACSVERRRPTASKGRAPREDRRNGFFRADAGERDPVADGGRPFLGVVAVSRMVKADLAGRPVEPEHLDRAAVNGADARWQELALFELGDLKAGVSVQRESERFGKLHV